MLLTKHKRYNKKGVVSVLAVVVECVRECREVLAGRLRCLLTSAIREGAVVVSETFTIAREWSVCFLTPSCTRVSRPATLSSAALVVVISVQLVNIIYSWTTCVYHLKLLSFVIVIFWKNIIFIYLALGHWIPHFTLKVI